MLRISAGFSSHRIFAGAVAAVVFSDGGQIFFSADLFFFLNVERVRQLSNGVSLFNGESVDFVLEHTECVYCVCYI